MVPNLSVDFAKRDDKDRLFLPLWCKTLIEKDTWLTDGDIAVKGKVLKSRDGRIYAEIDWDSTEFNVFKIKELENGQKIEV